MADENLKDSISKITSATKNYIDAKDLEIKRDLLGGLKFVKITQADYDSLTVKDPNTIYFITQDNGDINV